VSEAHFNKLSHDRGAELPLAIIFAMAGDILLASRHLKRKASFIRLKISESGKTFSHLR